MVNATPPLTVKFEIDDTRKPVPFSLLDDEFEEGFENFTLQLDPNTVDETVKIVVGSAMINIKDDDGEQFRLEPYSSVIESTFI